MKWRSGLTVGIEEGCEEIDCVGVYSCSFVFGRVEDCFADIT